ncbi:hypothetical protein A2U01_0036845, partial [Trifolium medium]|nr:hypothetical protein [Trifolium medium]
MVGSSMGEDDVVVVEEVGEGLCGLAGEVDEGAGIGGGGLGRSSGRGCK